MNCWKKRGGDAPEMYSVRAQRRPGNGGSAEANLSWGQNAVASYVSVIRPFEGPFGLETAGLKVTRGFLPPGSKPSAGCNDVVSPIAVPGRPQLSTHVPAGMAVWVSLGHGTCQHRSCSLCKAQHGCPALPRVTRGLHPKRGRRAVLPFPSSSCLFWMLGAPGAGLVCTRCRRNPETLNCCRNILAQAL